jgi:hypothetical protein
MATDRGGGKQQAEARCWFVGVEAGIEARGQMLEAGKHLSVDNVFGQHLKSVFSFTSL